MSSSNFLRCHSHTQSPRVRLLLRAATVTCLLLASGPLQAQEKPAASLATVPATAAQPQSRPSFGGSWKTTFGTMELRQNADRISGHYDFPTGKATLEGTLEGGRLTFRYREPTGVEGEGCFDLAADGKTFSGRWREQEGVWLPWKGERLPEKPVVWSPWSGKRVGQPVRERTFTGSWDSTFGTMVLLQQGDILYGTYDFRSGRAVIIGTLEKGKFTFSYEEPTGAVGEGSFELSADGQSFSGKWRQTEHVRSPRLRAQDGKEGAARVPTAPGQVPKGYEGYQFPRY